MPSLQKWVDMLAAATLPVLSRTVHELKLLRCDGEAATPSRVAQIVLHDPIMTVKVLQYLQRHRTQRRSAEITTIAHALMMLGTDSFYSQLGEQITIETQLIDDQIALDGLRLVISRARHAALYAQDWSLLRHDMDPEEIMIAALLHDLAEMMLWCFAPPLAIEIADRQMRDSTLRSDEVQRAVIGFRLHDLQLELVRVWQLPELLHVLMDETQAHNPRKKNIMLAAAVARHSAQSWSNLALPYDYMHVAQLLGLSYENVMMRIETVALQANSEWEWYGVQPRVQTVASHTSSESNLPEADGGLIV